MIEIDEVGPQVTVQDLGRPGYRALGVTPSGAFDRAALRLANRLVGNREQAPALEVLLGGLAFRVDAAVTVALTGAPCPGLPYGVATTLAAGTRVRLGHPRSGLRSYLAVRGGIDVPPVLGSCSTDSLSGLGPDAVRPGDRFGTGSAAVGSVSGVAAAAAGRVGGPVVLDLGPRDGWFTPTAVAALTTTTWVVRAESDRIGVRLDGPPLERSHAGELPSEPALPGAVQVPPDGRPIVFGPDAPVTGGYPVIAVLRELDAVAQLRPGDRVRFSTGRDPLSG